MTDKHTPLPWKLRKYSSGCEIDGADGRDVLTMRSNTEDADADAAFIVRAVNAHDELVHFAKEVKRIADEGLLTPEWSKQAERLIAKAEARP